MPADHKGLNREEGVIRRSSSSAGLRNFGNAGDQRNGSHTPKPDIPAVRNESLAKGLQARHLLRALGRPREESLAHKPSRRWDQSMSPDWTRPTDSQPAGNYGLIRSHSFESSVGDLYVAASQHETTGAFLSMESSPFPYVTPSIHGEGATSEQPFRSTSAEDTSRKAGKTPPPPRMPARRLSEGSSCGSRDALRPGLHRNFSSTNSVTSYWSRLSANDTDGASSNAENEILDKHLLARLKSSGKSMYAATGPTSPLSDDGIRLSDANAELARAVKRGGAKPRSIMLSTLLFGLRLLAVVPATLGSLALIWPIVQGEIWEPSAIANSLMALPWVSQAATWPLDFSNTILGLADDCDGGVLFRTYLGPQPAMVIALRSGSYAPSIGLSAITVLALHLFDPAIYREYRHTSGLDRGGHDNSLLSVGANLGHQQRTRPAATASCRSTADLCRGLGRR